MPEANAHGDGRPRISPDYLCCRCTSFWRQGRPTALWTGCFRRRLNSRAKVGRLRSHEPQMK